MSQSIIKSLKLERFKNFRDATLSLGPFTVIVGTNASGKSNLRDAFRFVHGMGRGYTLAEIIGTKYAESGEQKWEGIRGGTREIATYGEHSFSISTVLRDTVGKLHHKIAVDLANEKYGPRVTSESLSGVWNRRIYSASEPDAATQREARQLSVELPGDEKNGRHTKRLRFLDNQPVLSQLAAHREIRKEFKEAALRFSNAVESMRFLDLSPEAMKTPSTPGQTVLGDRGENLSSVLSFICLDSKKKHALMEWISTLTPLDVADLEFESDPTGRMHLFLRESNGQRTSAYSASDGTLRFLGLLAALLGRHPLSLFFLEELEAGIHPTRLHLLIQLIEQQATQRKVQVIATTHSPQLLAMLSEESREHAAIVYRLEGSSEARIQRIVDLPDAQRVLEKQSLSRLHESGWLEDAVAFAQSAESGG